MDIHHYVHNASNPDQEREEAQFRALVIEILKNITTRITHIEHALTRERHFIQKEIDDLTATLRQSNDGLEAAVQRATTILAAKKE